MVHIRFLLVFILCSYNQLRSESLPTIYQSDKVWLQKSLSIGISALKKISISDYDFSLASDQNDFVDDFIDALDDTLTKRMLPVLYNKALTLKAWKAMRETRVANKIPTQDIDAAIAALSGQVAFLTKEIKKNGYEQLWNDRLDYFSNYSNILAPMGYQKNSDNYVVVENGVASCSGLPSSRRKFIADAILARVKNKHNGNYAEYFSKSVSRLSLITLGLRFYPAKKDLSFTN